jgi:hypothetical protein
MKEEEETEGTSCHHRNGNRFTFNHKELELGRLPFGKKIV